MQRLYICLNSEKSLCLVYDPYLLDLLQSIAFCTLVGKGMHVKGERENTKPFPLSPSPFPNFYKKSILYMALV
ncbi:hypothetical protein NSTC745_05873 [Nostoc sp. DSM 114161]